MTLRIARALSPPEFAKRYGINPGKVLALIQAGHVRAVNVALDPHGQRPRWRITVEALADFEARRSSTPPPKPARRRSPQITRDFFA